MIVPTFNRDATFHDARVAPCAAGSAAMGICSSD